MSYVVLAIIKTGQKKCPEANSGRFLLQSMFSYKHFRMNILRATIMKSIFCSLLKSQVNENKPVITQRGGYPGEILQERSRWSIVIRLSRPVYVSRNDRFPCREFVRQHMQERRAYRYLPSVGAVEVPAGVPAAPEFTPSNVA